MLSWSMISELRYAGFILMAGVCVPLALGIWARLFLHRIDDDDARNYAAHPLKMLALKRIAQLRSEPPTNPEPNPVHLTRWPDFTSPTVKGGHPTDPKTS